MTGLWPNRFTIQLKIYVLEIAKHIAILSAVNTTEIDYGVAPCFNIFCGEKTITEAKLIFCEYRDQPPYLAVPSCSGCGEKSDDQYPFVTTTPAPSIITTTVAVITVATMRAQETSNAVPMTTTMTTTTTTTDLPAPGGFIHNDRFDREPKYLETAQLGWTVVVPEAVEYELTIMALRSCDPKIKRLNMTKEPVYVTAKPILVVMNVKSHRSSRSSGFKM